MIKVDGEPDTLVYSGKRHDRVYLPEGGTPQTMPDQGQPLAAAANKEERIKRGENVFTANCVACHQANGQGIPAAFPPLAASDFLNADKARSIKTVVHGLTGEVTVNGQKFNSVMPALALNDEDVANVLTYVYSAWNNNGTEITPKDVAEVRAVK
jgi:nitrite reductase (NO-forming)